MIALFPQFYFYKTMMNYVTKHENQIKFEFGEGTVALTLNIYIKLHIKYKLLLLLFYLIM